MPLANALQSPAPCPCNAALQTREMEYALTFTIPASNLLQREGAINCLAVEVHDGDGTDLRFDLVLGVLPRQDPPAALLDASGLPLPLPGPSPIPCPSAPPLHVQGGTEEGVAVHRGPYLLNAAPTAIVIRWRTSHAIRGAVRYAATTLDSVVVGAHRRLRDGTVTPNGISSAHLVGGWQQVASVRCPGYDQEVTLVGLTPDTVYAYHVVSGEDGGPVAALTPATAIHRFRTPPVTGGSSDRPSTFQTTRIWAAGDSGGCLSFWCPPFELVSAGCGGWIRG